MDRLSSNNYLPVFIRIIVLLCAMSIVNCTKTQTDPATATLLAGETRLDVVASSKDTAPIAWKPRSIKFGPSPSNGHELTEVETEALVNAFIEIKNAFWLSSDGYRPMQTGKPVPLAVRMDESDFQECLSQSHYDRWSTLMVHYFCHFPSSKAGVHPNIRSCLLKLGIHNPTLSVRIDGAPIERDKSPFQTAYDICSFFPIDREGFKKDGAAMDWAQYSLIELPNLKSFLTAREPIGPFAWIQKHQEDVFKFLMFGNKCSLTAVSQWAVLQKVHGSGQYVDSTGCFQPVAAPAREP